ncbi:MFS transporter [Paenibacillus sedimenti]|uniref:MFS transporter n=1 Tax=Paenibacillus sedimenti TaxID=2770274 RepID=A0A926QLH2_9BACL|nr:MFS transporter [Paenibacillus sedimenti]MBD0382587.1 MFS transporter [Paenibacillus sedimenti]
MIKSISALPPGIRHLALLIFIYHAGASFIWPVYMPYMNQELGISLTTGGTLLSIHFAMQFAGNVTGGILFDRWKAKTTIVLSSAVPLACTVAIGIGGSLEAFIACFLPLGFFSGFFYAVTNAWATRLHPSGGRSNSNMVYVALNVAGALGTALGGTAYAVSHSLAYWGNAVFHVVFLLLFFVYFRKHSLSVTAHRKNDPASALQPAGIPSLAKWIALGTLSTGLMVTWFMYMQWLTIIPTLFQNIHLPSYSYNLLWTINAIIVVLAQPLLAWGIRKCRLSLKAQLLWGGLIFVVSSLVTAQASGYAGFVVAMVIMTFAEMLVWPSVPALASDYAEPGREGTVQGLVAGGPTSGRVLGPVVGGMLFEQTGSSASLYASTVFAALGVACFIVFVLLAGKTKNFNRARWFSK